MSAATPVRDIRLASTDVSLTKRPDGTMYVKSVLTLGDFPARMTDRLDHWAKVRPDQTFIAQRTPAGPWRRLTYAEAASTARRIGQALATRPVSTKRPIAILSGNDIEHALLGLGAMYAGVPTVDLGCESNRADLE